MVDSIWEDRCLECLTLRLTLGLSRLLWSGLTLRGRLSDLSWSLSVLSSRSCDEEVVLVPQLARRVP